MLGQREELRSPASGRSGKREESTIQRRDRTAADDERRRGHQLWLASEKSLTVRTVPRWQARRDHSHEGFSAFLSGLVSSRFFHSSIPEVKRVSDVSSS